MKTNVLAALLPHKEAITCRHCGSTDVRVSHKATGSSEYVVYRCRACKHHFKVVSARPRIQAVLSVGVFLLILAGVVVSFFIDSAPEEVEYLPRVDVANGAALAKAQSAAKRGDAQAEYDLGLTHWHNENYKEALPLLRAAAAHGHAEAQYLMGMAYLEGHGIVQNYRGAMEHFTKAAEQGHLEAEYRLGIFHRDGLAAPRDRETAYVWLNVAAAQGHMEALAQRERLTMAMSGEEILRAQEASARMHEKLSARNAPQPKSDTAKAAAPKRDVARPDTPTSAAPAR
jgi:DNA-directed RNA polymerase subunit RPC12/RpoP